MPRFDIDLTKDVENWDKTGQVAQDRGKFPSIWQTLNYERPQIKQIG